MAAPQLGGLDRILPAMPDQRAANEHDRRQPVEQAKLANRVRHIDLGRAVWAILRASGVPRSSLAMRRARRHWARVRDGAARSMSGDPGKFVRRRACASMITFSSPAWVEAAAITGRPCDCALQGLQALLGRRAARGTSSLRLPVTTTFAARPARSIAQRRARCQPDKDRRR